MSSGPGEEIALGTQVEDGSPGNRDGAGDICPAQQNRAGSVFGEREGGGGWRAQRGDGGRPLVDAQGVVFVGRAHRDTQEADVRIGEIAEPDTGIGHHRAPADVVGEEVVAVGVGVETGAGGIGAVMVASEVVSQFVGEDVVADDVGHLDGRVGEVASGREQVADACIVGVAGVAKKGYHVGPVLVAQCLGLLHVTIPGKGDTPQLGGEGAGFRVGGIDRDDSHEVDRDIDLAVQKRLIGLRRRLIGEGDDGGIPPDPGCRTGGVEDQHVDGDGVRGIGHHQTARAKIQLSNSGRGIGDGINPARGQFGDS